MPSVTPVSRTQRIYVNGVTKTAAVVNAGPPGPPGMPGEGVLAHAIQTIPWGGAGSVVVVVGGQPWTAPWNGTFVRAILDLKTAPAAGQSCVVDLNKNGTTIFTNQTHRPRLNAGETHAEFTVFDVTSFLAGQQISPDVDIAGGVRLGIQLQVLPSD